LRAEQNGNQEARRESLTGKGHDAPHLINSKTISRRKKKNHRDKVGKEK